MNKGKELVLSFKILHHICILFRICHPFTNDSDDGNMGIVNGFSKCHKVSPI